MIRVIRVKSEESDDRAIDNDEAVAQNGLKVDESAGAGSDMSEKTRRGERRDKSDESEE